MPTDPQAIAEVEGARAAILARDLRGAVRRVGVVLARAPRAPTTRELVARLGLLVVDADAVAPSSARLLHGEAMVRALLLGRAERYTEAAAQLIEADAAAPDRGYFDAFAYLGEGCPLVEGVDAARIADVALSVMRRGACTAGLFAFLLAVRDRWPGVELAMMAATRAMQLRG